MPIFRLLKHSTCPKCRAEVDADEVPPKIPPELTPVKGPTPSELLHINFQYSRPMPRFN